MSGCRALGDSDLPQSAIEESLPTFMILLLRAFHLFNERFISRELPYVGCSSFIDGTMRSTREEENREASRGLRDSKD